MNKLQSFENLCRVCLSGTEDLDENNQLVSLNPQQTEKLIYIGDSSEIVGLHKKPLILCSHCHKALDDVHSFVVKFNSSKAKVRQNFRLYFDDAYQVDELNLATIDTTEGLNDSDHKFYENVNVKTLSTTFESPPRTVTSFPNLTIEPKKPKRNHKKPNPKPKVKIGPECKIKEIKSEYINDPAHDSLVERGGNVCHLCAKQFSTRANMLRHVREHMGRRFECYYENCRTLFTQKSSLQVHLARHEGRKPYECTTCGKGFSQSKSLVIHIRIHTGESPFECDYCQKSFKQKSNLIRHFKSHRSRKPRAERFECPKCNQLLSSKQSLIRHLLHKHEIMGWTV